MARNNRKLLWKNRRNTAFRFIRLDQTFFLRDCYFWLVIYPHNYRQPTLRLPWSLIVHYNMLCLFICTGNPFDVSQKANVNKSLNMTHILDCSLSKRMTYIFSIAFVILLIDNKNDAVKRRIRIFRSLHFSHILMMDYFRLG